MAINPKQAINTDPNNGCRQYFAQEWDEFENKMFIKT